MRNFRFTIRGLLITTVRSATCLGRSNEVPARVGYLSAIPLPRNHPNHGAAIGFVVMSRVVGEPLTPMTCNQRSHLETAVDGSSHIKPEHNHLHTGPFSALLGSVCEKFTHYISERTFVSVPETASEMVRAGDSVAGLSNEMKHFNV